MSMSSLSLQVYKPRLDLTSHFEMVGSDDLPGCCCTSCGVMFLLNQCLNGTSKNSVGLMETNCGFQIFKPFILNFDKGLRWLGEMTSQFNSSDLFAGRDQYRHVISHNATPSFFPCLVSQGTQFSCKACTVLWSLQCSSFC